MKAIAKKGVEEEIVTNIGVDDPVMSTPLESDTSPFAEGSRAMCEAPSRQGPDREPGAVVLGAHRWPRALHALGLTTNALLRLLRRATSSTEVVRSDRAVLPGHLCELCLDAPAVRLQPAPWGGEMGVCRTCPGQRGLMAPFAQQPSPQRSTPSLCPHCGQQAAWMCENYCPPHVSGGMRGTPAAGCDCGSTVWSCASCGQPWRRARPGSEEPSEGGVRRRGLPIPVMVSMRGDATRVGAHQTV